jgi:CHAD domain-containing protein
MITAMSSAQKSSFLGQKRRELVHAAKRIRRDSSPENFHAARVATRRLRAALRVLEESDREEPRERAVDVRRLARRLGRVRDLDVVLDRVNAFARDHAREGSDDLAAFYEEMRAQRKRARRRVLRTLSSEGFSELTKNLRTLARELEHSGEAVSELGRSLLFARGRELLALNIDATNAGSAALHRYRVRIKRFRYVLELSPSSTHLATELLAQAKHAQDQLGLLNDAFVAEARLARFVEEQPRYQNSVALARFAAACRDDQVRCRADLPAVNATFRAALAAFLAEEERATQHGGPGITAVRSTPPVLGRVARR